MRPHQRLFMSSVKEVLQSTPGLITAACTGLKETAVSCKLVGSPTTLISDIAFLLMIRASLVPRPHPKIGKGAWSHLCKQFLFGVDKSRSSISNY